MKKALSLLLVLAMVLALAPAVFAEGTGVPEDAVQLTIGYNNIEAADVTYSYTASEDGTLSLSMGTAIMGEVSAMVYIAGDETNAQTLAVDSSLELSLKSGETAVVEVTAAGYATLTASWNAGSASGGEEEEEEQLPAYDIYIYEVPYTVDVPAGETVLCALNYFGGQTVTVTGGGAYVIYNGTTYTAVDGVVSFSVADYYVTVEIGNSGSADASYVVSYTVPVGTMDNPEVVEAGTYTASVEEGSWGYYYSWTADEAGTLTVSVSAEGGWMYSVNNATTYAYGDTHWSDDDPVVSSETVSVSAGDEIQIMVNTYDPSSWNTPAGEVTVTLTFTPAGAGEGEGGEGGEGEATEGTTVELNTATSGDEIWVSVDAPVSGTISITISGNPGYQFWLRSPAAEEGAEMGYMTFGIQGKDETTYTYDITENFGEYAFQIQCYDKAGWDVGDGTVTYSVSFTPKEVEVEKAEYEISDIIITEEGTYTIPMEYADMTVVTFSPVESGVYEITVNGENLIAYVGGSSAYIYSADSVEWSQLVEWTCIDAGHWESDTILDENWDPIDIERWVEGTSAMIGILSEDESVEITVEKVGEYVPSAEEAMEWTVYELETKPVTYEPAEGDKVVELADTDTIVLGSDGYYHYGTKNGPIVYIDMSSDGEFAISIASAMGTGRIGSYIYDEDGNLVAKYDYGNALCQIQDAGMTPLTDEILTIINNVAVGQGWWSYLGLEDSENPWMTLCSYVIVNDLGPSATGDTMSIAGVIVAMMTSVTGLVVTKKKFF